MTDREYNQCVHDHADNIYRFILKNLRNEEDARDVVQSSYEKLWNHRSSVDVTKSKSYLFTIAHHQMIDHIRKVKKIHIQDEIPETAISSGESIKDVRKILQKALDRLNDTQRSLVMLKDYEGYSYAEIAEIMGLSESQVKVYLHRARLILKNYLVKPENVI